MWNTSPTIRNRHYGDRDCDDGGWDDPELWSHEDELQSPPIEPLTPPPTFDLITPTPTLIMTTHQQQTPNNTTTTLHHHRTALMKPQRSSLKSLNTQGYDNNPSPSKKNVSFQSVIIYYFTRSQGFISIPTEGGSTLGMCTHHFMSQEFNLETHEQLRRRIHREILLRLRHAKTRRREYYSSSDSEDYFNENDYCDISDSDLNLDKFTFLQPISVKNRRSLLRAAGIVKIDAAEKRDCKRIRDSRERTGCKCDGVCNPANCECSRLGVNCHVDRESFPCGCSASGCHNPSGRLEFDGKRVRTHFIDTLIRLGFGSNLKPKDFNLLRERQHCEVSGRGEIQCVNMNGQTNLSEITTGLRAIEQQQESNVEVESIEDMPEISYTLYEYELNELYQNGQTIICNTPVELENHNYVRKHPKGHTTPSIPHLAGYTNIISNPSIPAQIQSAQTGDLSMNLQSNNNVASIVEATRLDHPYIVGGYPGACGQHFPIGQTSFAGDCNSCDTITMNPTSSDFGTYVDQHQILNCNNDQRYCAAVQSLCDHHYFTTNNKKIMFVNNNHLNAQHLDGYSKHMPSREGE